MSDRRNRRILGLIGLLLLIGGGLSACFGGGLFGAGRASRDVFDQSGVIGWWNEGGWMSFAVVVVIGVIALVIGLALVLSQLSRNDGLHHTPTVTFPAADGARGETAMQSPALNHSLKTDLEKIPDVHGASVGLFGRYPDIELRAVLDVGDDADLDGLPARVDDVLGRMETTTGVRPDPVLVTVRFKAVERERQLA